MSTIAIKFDLFGHRLHSHVILLIFKSALEVRLFIRFHGFFRVEAVLYFGDCKGIPEIEDFAVRVNVTLFLCVTKAEILPNTLAELLGTLPPASNSLLTRLIPILSL